MSKKKQTNIELCKRCREHCLKEELKEIVNSLKKTVAVNIKIPVDLYGSCCHGIGILVIDRACDWSEYLEPEKFREKVITKDIKKYFKEELKKINKKIENLSKKYKISEEDIGEMIVGLEDDRDAGLTE
jgi:hypothetical protein